MEAKLDAILRSLEGLRKEQDGFEKKLESFEGKLNNFKSRMNEFESKIESLDRKLDNFMVETGNGYKFVKLDRHKALYEMIGHRNQNHIYRHH
ncbi:hypothetical protein CFK37_04555 [Virgibacillus phasianinus]|uniref:Uncharacterized protein n=1 Tax=Virgibacillus phasianinus TaxID=2017483 RepID=A0A220TZM7_9BACI|nr:hypothetical protein [Virgibacillus phasianinus]ASK61494.1 hypothetical protein CFK37_04555 [Virgibacillus phasianinus]